MKTRGCTFQKKTIKVSLRFTSEDLATILSPSLCPSSPGSVQPLPPLAQPAAGGEAGGGGQPLTPLSIRRPSQPLEERVFYRKPWLEKSCIKSPSSPSEAEGRGGPAGNGLRAVAGGEVKARSSPLVRVRGRLTRSAAGITRSFPINVVPILITPVWVRLPKALGEEPFASRTIFLISHTKWEGKGGIIYLHTYARTERLRDTGECLY